MAVSLKSLRWARESEKRGIYIDDYKRRSHREGIATTAEGEEIYFCGEYHPGECAGTCGLPRLIRRREGRAEAARVAMGICSVFSASLATGPWQGEVIEVEYPGDPIWR